MYFDRSVMKTGAGAGLLFVSPLRKHMRYVVCLHFLVSNNKEEYEALLSGLRIAIELGIKHLDVRGDSQLIIDQVMKEASCHNEKMEAYCNAVRRLKDKFDGLELNHVAHKYNEKVARDLTKPSINFKNPAEAIGAAPEPSGLRPPSHWPNTPRQMSPRPWTLKPRSTRRMRLKRWKSTRPRLRVTGVPSTSTG